MDANKDTFNYTYSAKQQREIESILEKYLPQEESKLEQLRRLDRKAAKKGTVVSVAVGIIGCLLMGVGMCCSMVWMGSYFIPGIIIGLSGIALVAAAYPIYSRITKAQRRKIAPEIIRLTDELTGK
ncbi:MAG TPA: hypothetical protein IAB77_08715 [Candidatus Scatomorpha intestinavium]|uniref:Transmembrane protein n=1 Tax=Candidatus Scatomorpha intestinavium TaxID=2840922 RepID=A0A9D1CTQ4_9FIRM|nr:hypothetical protein [Candidatus Scatomorpha intestinavium]